MANHRTQDSPPELGRLGLVRVTLRAELGRASLRFRTIEQLEPGTIVTLDRLAGEPVEVRCRGHCIARGEVVIQDEAFAIRVTEIVQRRIGVTDSSQRPRRRK